MFFQSKGLNGPAWSPLQYSEIRIMRGRQRGKKEPNFVAKLEQVTKNCPNLAQKLGGGIPSGHLILFL